MMPSHLQTMGHNWIISPATCDQIDSGADPTVFNPFEVVRDSAECSSLNQLRYTKAKGLWVVQILSQHVVPMYKGRLNVKHFLSIDTLSFSRP